MPPSEGLVQPGSEPGAGPRFHLGSVFAGFAGGLFSGVALALLAVALLANSRQEVSFPLQPQVAGAADEAAITGPTPDPSPRTNAVADIHIGPSEAYAIIGTIGRGEALQLVGRNQDATWLAVRFPPGSTAIGWLPMDLVSGLDEMESLAVTFATPLPRTTTARATPSASFPFQPAPSAGSSSQQAPRPTPRPAATATVVVVTPEPLPDLIVSGMSRLADGRVSVTVTNQGGALHDQFIFVLVRDLLGASEMLLSPSTQLAAGASVTLTTQAFRVDQEKVVTAVANPNGSARESNQGNNTRQATLGQGR